MSTMLIFVFGSVITAMVTVAVVLIGLSEAADQAHSRPEDLMSWGREAPKRERNDLGKLARGDSDT